MARNAMRGLPQVRSSGPASNPWSGASLTGTLVALVGLMIFSGCDKPPTFSELIGGKKKEPPATPAPVAQAPTKSAPPVQLPKEPEKPKRAAQEVLAEFNSTPGERRTNALVTELASNPEAADQLTELDLTRSGVNDVGLKMLPKFERVETLKLDGCQYSNASLANVVKMKSLTSLSINGGVPGDSTCDKGMALIQGMQQLTALSIEGANITPEGLAHIAQMTWLEKLSVARTRFNEDSLQILAPLVNLKELNLSGTMVRDGGFKYLRPFNQLESLSIGAMPIKGKGLMDLANDNAFPNLRKLSLASNLSLDDTAYQGVFLLKKTLESLDVGGAALTDDRFTKAVAKCSKLERLLLHDNPGLDDRAMVELPRLRKLKSLYFWKNNAISDNSLPYIARLSKLEKLEMDVTSISENGARELKRRLKNCEITYNYKKLD